MSAENGIQGDFQMGQKTRRGVRPAVRARTAASVASSEAATAAFRIFQEALTNVLRHAVATRVDVRAEVHGDNLLLEISDNGKGISLLEVDSRQSLGLLGMRERASLIHGTVDITSRPGMGTTLAVTIPLSTKAAA